jgi:hypothetical protein
VSIRRFRSPDLDSTRRNKLIILSLDVKRTAVGLVDSLDLSFHAAFVVECGASKMWCMVADCEVWALTRQVRDMAHTT